MFDWLHTTLQNDHDVTIAVTAGKLIVAFVYGCVIALAHAIIRRGHDDRANGLGTTLVLLCVIVALVTYVIGNNVARAFGLVGAISIVRFRTEVGDTRDTAFVIFSVVIGMAVGAGFVIGATVAVPIIIAACALVEFAYRQRSHASIMEIKADTMLTAESAIRDHHGKAIVRYRLMRASTGGKANDVDLTYRIWLSTEAKPTALLDDIGRRPGILKADWSVR